MSEGLAGGDRFSDGDEPELSTARNGEWIVLGTAMALNALFSVAVVLTATLEVWEVYLVGFIGG